jgi:hypothetical protein
LGLENNVADVPGSGKLPESTDVRLFPSADDEPAGGVCVVPLQRFHDLAQGEVVPQERIRADKHVVLPDEPPEAMPTRSLLEIGLAGARCSPDRPEFHRGAPSRVYRRSSEVVLVAQLRRFPGRPLAPEARRPAAGRNRCPRRPENHDHLRKPDFDRADCVTFGIRPSVARWGK